MNGVGYYDSSPFENCSYVFDPNDKARVKMITGTSTSCTFSTPFPVTSHASSSLGDMNVEMDTFQDADFKATTKVDFSVDLFTQHEYELESMGDLIFKINFSFYDEFPVFAIRIKFQRLSQMICTEKLNPKFIYRIGHSNSDVYLPREHPHAPHAYFLGRFSYGYNKGICRVLIVGQTCSILVSHYPIIRIHHYPHKSLISPHEVDISLKKTLNCSIKCPLNFGIFGVHRH